MKPENVEKMEALAHKYHNYFAFMMTCAETGFDPSTVISALGTKIAIQILAELEEGGDEITQVLDEIYESEMGENKSPKNILSELTEEENKWVDSILSKFKE